MVLGGGNRIGCPDGRDDVATVPDPKVQLRSDDPPGSCLYRREGPVHEHRPFIVPGGRDRT